jgi:hypothetical protein
MKTITLNLSVVLGLLFGNSAFASWYCQGECQVTEELFKQANNCGREEQESCERSGWSWVGPNSNAYGSPYCACRKYEYSKYSISAYERTQWLAENQLRKQCEDRKAGRGNIWYGQHNVTCKGE